MHGHPISKTLMLRAPPLAGVMPHQYETLRQLRAQKQLACAPGAQYTQRLPPTDPVLQCRTAPVPLPCEDQVLDLLPPPSAAPRQVCCWDVGC